MQIPLEVGDEVVTSYQWRDSILVITKFGVVYVIEHQEDGQGFHPRNLRIHKL